MTLPEIYEYIILLIVTIVTFNQCKRYKYKIFDLNQTLFVEPDKIGVILCVFFTLLIGLRPMSPEYSALWADSSNYNRSYLANEGFPFHLNLTLYEPIFENLFNFWASMKLGINSFFLLCDAIYFGCTYIACKKWFPNDILPSYLAFLGAFSTYSYSYNGVRAGVAAAIFLIGLAYYEKTWTSIFFVILSAGFHHSMQLPIAAYFVTYFFKNPKLYFYGWCFCALMAILHVSFFQNLFVGMSDESGRGYLAATGKEEDDYVTGFRPDFLLYSAMPIWIGYKLVIKEKIQISKTYSLLLRMYLCTNGIWLLCMYASYTNRIAYLSWFMYPFVLIYPFLKEDLRDFIFLKTNNQYTMFAKVFAYHLYFTLFMELIYYRLLKS